MRRLKLTLLATAVAVICSGPLQAASVEERLDRVERMVNSQSLLEMLQRIESLEAELQQLRGQLEEQQHAMEGLKGRQRELYLDVDRRLSRLEREGVAPAPAATPIPTPTTPQTSAPTTSAPQQKAPPPAAPSTQNVQQEREAYQKAFDMLRELRYAQATTAFREFLQDYPNGRYTHIAQYWLGEASYAQRKFEQAISAYQALLQNHPDSPKRAEAMLKIGYSHHELKQDAEARKVLEQLVEQFPDSTEAGQARKLLRQLRNNAG